MQRVKAILTHVAGFPRRRARSTRTFVLFLAILFALEPFLHASNYHVVAPNNPLDQTFSQNCLPRDWPPWLPPAEYDSYKDPLSPPPDKSEPRENATLIMLARKSKKKAAVAAVRSIEEQWNKWYRYPIVFLSEEPWDEDFKDAVRTVAGYSELTFEEIPQEMWVKPHDYADKLVESHRFWSGFFFDHPALKPYKYFWRVDYELALTCRVPYDPFRAMRINDKIYGYGLTSRDADESCPRLYRTASDFKGDKWIGTSSLWASMVSPSWAPIPLRWLFMSLSSLFPERDSWGDIWNKCHFASDFEMGDMDFFRSKQYRKYFDRLEKAGGPRGEECHEAPVHSLALAMFAKPEQVHYFEDIGYEIPPFRHCPPKDMGCGCNCNPDGVDRGRGSCLKKLRVGLGG